MSNLTCCIVIIFVETLLPSPKLPTHSTLKFTTDRPDLSIILPRKLDWKNFEIPALRTYRTHHWLNGAYTHTYVKLPTKTDQPTNKKLVCLVGLDRM